MKHMLFISQYVESFRSYAYLCGSFSGNLGMAQPFSTS